mgnify:CR=1 FL=1
MKNKDLHFDRTHHVLYSKACEKEIKKAIAKHYKEEEREEVWTKFQLQYVEYLKDWRTDLGGKKNFHNGKGGTYDSIALMTYYAVCKEVTSLQEIEEMESNLILGSFKKLKIVNANRPFVKKLMLKAFKKAEKQCSKWQDYLMHVDDYKKGQPIYYEFTACPVCEFAKKHGLLKVMPALCNPDYAAMELLHAKLIRTTTCANGDKCDYTIVGDQDPYIKEHHEYVDEAGYRRNK